VKDDKVNEIARGPADTEGELRRLVPSPVLPGLRRRVLDRALEARENTALTQPMRTVAVVCLILIVAVLGIDPLIKRHESARMAALLDGRSPRRAVAEEASELADMVGGQVGEFQTIMRLQIVASSGNREADFRDGLEARKRLKGWLENEGQEILN
jgi:hypothetical protein